MGTWLMDQPKTIVLQPTSLCPLACTYCYLPERHLKQEMTLAVAEAVATGIQEDWPQAEIVWHGGEPLAIGRARFLELLEPFEALRCAGRIKHKVQTGATLITDEWCEIFQRHEIGVGVSLDGPRFANRHRVDRGGRPMFDRTVAGIETLKRNGLPFTVLAVVSQDATGRAPDVLSFLHGLGPRSVGLNVEAKEGANARGTTPAMEQAQQFWRDTFAWCKDNPGLTIREVKKLFGFLRLPKDVRDADAQHGLIPTIGWHGDVVLLSPELLGIRDWRYHDFVAGNVLADPLPAILKRAPDLLYVQEFIAGLEACRATCEFWSYCQGAHAGNRYFEHGSFAATETDHCRVSVQAPALALAAVLTNGKK